MLIQHRYDQATTHTMMHSLNSSNVRIRIPKTTCGHLKDADGENPIITPILHSALITSSKRGTSSNQRWKRNFSISLQRLTQQLISQPIAAASRMILALLGETPGLPHQQDSTNSKRLTSFIRTFMFSLSKIVSSIVDILILN